MILSKQCVRVILIVYQKSQRTTVVHAIGKIIVGQRRKTPCAELANEHLIKREEFLFQRPFLYHVSGHFIQSLTQQVRCVIDIDDENYGRQQGLRCWVAYQSSSP